jgi:hypothetical protein
MNEDLRRHPERAFLLFTKVYQYTTNTKNPWNMLTDKERNDKTFQWSCNKWFFISKHPLTEAQCLRHIRTCPELYEEVDNVLKNNVDPSKKWKYISHWFDIYEAYPLRNEEQFKLLVNTIGLRMLHFVENLNEIVPKRHPTLVEDIKK